MTYGIGIDGVTQLNKEAFLVFSPPKPSNYGCFFSQEDMEFFIDTFYFSGVVLPGINITIELFSRSSSNDSWEKVIDGYQTKFRAISCLNEVFDFCSSKHLQLLLNYWKKYIGINLL